MKRLIQWSIDHHWLVIALSALLLAASAVLGVPVLIEFAETGLVLRIPTWVLSVGLLLLSMLMLATGLVLDSVSRGRAEQKRIFYLSMPGRQNTTASTPGASKRAPLALMPRRTRSAIASINSSSRPGPDMAPVSGYRANRVPSSRRTLATYSEEPPSSP